MVDAVDGRRKAHSAGGGVEVSPRPTGLKHAEEKRTAGCGARETGPELVIRLRDTLLLRRDLHGARELLLKHAPALVALVVLVGEEPQKVDERLVGEALASGWPQGVGKEQAGLVLGEAQVGEQGAVALCARPAEARVSK